ncbi:hypothetical protein MMC29_007958 [Sticta canariensis]|nr:hypothetical protein [Sticta canariensis]
MKQHVAAEISPHVLAASVPETAAVGEVNISGHRQELHRNFGLWSVCGVGIVTGNVWSALGGSIVVALYNGGPPGAIYELIAVAVFYAFISASLAELASAMPASSGVYHWAAIAAGRYGRACGFFAGWLNFLAWVVGAASISFIVGNQTVAMYAAFHDGFVVQRWHVFVSYLICTWISCATVLFANKALPLLVTLGMFCVVAGVVMTIIVCAVMPHVNGTPYASNAFVWKDWENETGYSSNGFVFLAGMLNGAYALGTPDCVSHLAEEIPKPSVNVPKAIFAQMSIGFLTGVFFLIAIFYAINDFDAVVESGTFPLAEIYRQVTGSRGGSLGLLILIFLPTFLCCIGCYITAGRMYWTLARDNATPFSSYYSRVSPTFRNPFNATLFCGIIATVLGCIYVGSSTAFNAFVASFVELTTLSYLMAILPHLLSRRANVTPGWFWMNGVTGYMVNIVTCLYIIGFDIIFCFPYALPVDAKSMNYTSLITGGLFLFVAAWWFARQSAYVGPRSVVMQNEGDMMWGDSPVGDPAPAPRSEK